MKKDEPILVSLTYKVGKKYFTATLPPQKKGVPQTEGEPAILGFNSCGENCQCRDGFKWRYITWGGYNDWVKTNEPC